MAKPLEAAHSTHTRWGNRKLLVAVVLIFAIAYAAIALEHPIGISKSASALLGAGLLWTVYALSTGDHTRVEHELRETVDATAGIIFFLMGAMTTVEVIDAHDGFEIITSRIQTKSLTGLLWIVAWVTFFLSAILDNLLTTTIVMVSLIRKILDRDGDRLLFASLIVVAANAGGAWSPIGDVTTTMLWIGGQVSALGIIEALFLASVVNLLVPLAVLTYRLRGQPFTSAGPVAASGPATERNLMFALGLGCSFWFRSSNRSRTFRPSWEYCLDWASFGLLASFSIVAKHRRRDTI